MLIQDEGFLSRQATEFNLDTSLPSRLQKRQLLKLLGFPKSRDLQSCRATDDWKIESLFKEYSQGGLPFLLIISEKPARTIIPPLFTVKSVDKITWRNDCGKKKRISYDDMLRIIARFEPSTWVEFSGYIWSPKTIAGRLAYINQREQIIELQKGVVPRQIPSRKNFSFYSGSVSLSELQIRDYRDTVLALKNAGYPKILDFNELWYVVDYLARYFEAFEKMAKIAPLPALEFGFLPDQTLICVDIDWPSQWRRV